MSWVWATDIHLDHADEQAFDSFVESLLAPDPEGVLLTGDLSEAPTLVDHVERLAEAVGRPMRFVLGNHDFYRGGIEPVRAEMGRRFAQGPVRYLHGTWTLESRFALVGVDGWGDARLGDWAHTPLMLNDFRFIEDLRALDRPALTAKLRALGDREAEALEAPLAAAAEACDRVVVLTHVPPFEGACWYEGSTSHPDWLPYFTCDAVGAVLRAAAANRPRTHFEVLCGHTHGEGVVHIAPNLVVRTGRAEYGRPRAQVQLVA